MDNGTVLLSESSGWMDILEVFASGMTGSEAESVKSYFKSWSSADVVSLSIVSRLSLSQS
jgi:hypothetical protein